MPLNYKHFPLPYFEHKFLHLPTLSTSRYLIIWGRFIEETAQKIAVCPKMWILHRKQFVWFVAGWHESLCNNTNWKVCTWYRDVPATMRHDSFRLFSQTA